MPTNVDTLAAFAAQLRDSNNANPGMIHAAACALAQYLLADLRLPPTTARVILDSAKTIGAIPPTN